MKSGPAWQNSRAKRAFDVLAAGAFLLAAAPLFAVVAVLIRLDSDGPVFYRSARIGRNGRPFQMLKFRSMRAAAGPRVTSDADPRITAFGAWLRKWKIDEFPQVINVLRGEMSVVGPRPEDPAYVAHYTPEQRAVLAARPGLAHHGLLRNEQTILAGVAGPMEEVYIRHILPRKLARELEFLDRQSLAFDIRVIVTNITAILRPPAPSEVAQTPNAP